MNDGFDPQKFSDPIYKRILGLDEAKPIGDWYTLLGLERFESDEGKIDEAMRQRYEMIRVYQVGNFEDQALQLFDELGRAFTCLSSDADRLEYDATLRPQTADATQPPPDNATAAKAPPAPATAQATSVSSPAHPAKEAAVDDRTCPQCGKPTSPKATVCYQCGFKKSSPLQRRATKDPSTANSSAGSFRDLARQDLTPDQFLTKIREMRKLANATKQAAGFWRAPRSISSNNRFSSEEATSRCRRCGKGLMNASDAHGIPEAEVRRTLDFVHIYARKLESLGREQFIWPLSADAIRRVLQKVAGHSTTSVGLYCRRCALKIFRSPPADA